MEARRRLAADRSSRSGALIPHWGRALRAALGATLIMLASCTELRASGEPVQPAKVPRLPVIDGKLGDACWREATEYTGFSALRAEGLAEPETKFRVVYDDTRICFAVECVEPDMAAVVAQIDADDESAIWRDDALELCLGPAGRRDEYSHFIVNTLGARYDAMMTHGGGLVDWDADWQAAVQTGEQAWTAEVSIPFYSLAITPAVAPDTWRFNLARTRRAGGSLELTTWAALRQSYHEPSRFVPLGPIEVDFSAFCYAVGKPVKETVVRGDVLATSFELDIANATGGRRELQLEGWLVTRDEQVLIASTAVTMDEEETRRVRLDGFRVREPGAYTLYVLLSDDATRHMSSHAFEVRFVPLRVHLEQPSYRSTIYATQSLDQVRLRVEVGLSPADRRGLRLQVAIMAGDGEQLASKQIDQLDSPPIAVALPCADLAPGDYRIVAHLVDATGRAVSEDVRELHKLPPPGRGSEVRVDEKLNLLVDGEAFFPFGWYGYVPPQVAQREGCTALYLGSTLYIPAEEFLERLDECHQHGIMVMTCPAPRQDMWTQTSPYTPEERQQIAELVNAVKGHPAHLGWYMADEPGSRQMPVEELRERYELLRELDPYHPCIILNNSVEGLRSYVDAADILWPDPYPMYLRDGGTARPMTRISLFLDAGYEASQGTKTVWVCPEAFDWGVLSGDTDRVPASFAQHRCQTWMALNHGAKGIIYFNSQYSRNAPGLVLGTPYLAREIGHLKPVLMHGERRILEVSPDARVDAAAWQHEGQLLVAATNYTTEPVQADIELGEARDLEFRVLGEDRSVRAVRGTITDRFEPYAVHIYTTAPGQTGLPTLREMEASIEAFEAGLEKKGNVAFGASVTVSAASRERSLMYGLVADGVYYPPDDWLSMGWSARAAQLPAWCELDFGREHSIGKVVVVSGPDLQTYDVQCWQDGDWRTLGTVTDTTDKVKPLVFDPVTTDRIRILVKACDRGFVITEIEAYEAGAD